MNEVIGNLLPLSLGVSLSPFPIIMIVLLLGSSRAAANGVAFLLGWVVGLTAIIAVLTFALDTLKTTSDAPGTVAGIVRIALGLVLLVLAIRKFVRRFGSSDAGPLPRWMASASAYSPQQSVLTGLALSAANVKNIAITAAAGVTIGSADLALPQELWAMAAFLLMASVTVLAPVTAYLMAPKNMEVPLRGVMTWLRINHSIMTGLLLVVFGFLLIGNGIGSF